jgi:YVTN family beta-propeller protein
MKAKVLSLLVFMFIVIFACSVAVSVHAIGVTSTKTVGGSPWGVAYDSGKGEIFVVNSAAGTVLVLSDSNYALVETIAVGKSPYRDIYDSGKSEIFVANYGANSVSIISDKTNSVVATVPVGASPSSFAYDSGKGEIFVANSGDVTVSVISDSTNTVVATVTVGSRPFDLDYDSAKGEVFVANAYSRSVSVISDSSNQVVATISVGSGPLGVAYDSAKGEIFVANSVSNTVSVISDSTNTVVANMTVGSSPGAAVYDSDQGEIFILNRNSASVSVISDNTKAVTATLAVGTNPYGAAYDSNTSEVIVANEGDGTLSIISDQNSTSTSPNILQQVWVPKPVNAVAAVGVSAVVLGAVSLVFAALNNPLGEVGGKVGEKTKGIIPDNIKQWLEEVVSSRRKLDAVEKKGSLFKPTKTEIFAYTVSIIVLAISFSYVKVITLDQIWVLLPVFFATSVLVGFVQKFFSIVYLRSKGVWSEHKIWPFGLVLFLFTTFAFKVPFSSPTRNANQSSKFTERLGATVAASGILISLAFAGLFFLLFEGSYTAVGDAGLSMCVIGSFFGTFPVSPMNGKDIFDHSKPLWAGLFTIALIIFVAWLLLI